MMYLDTHVVIWLYIPRVDLLSARARELLEEEDLVISPMVLLELEYLRETNRLAANSAEVFQNLQSRIGLKSCDLPFRQVIESAAQLTWTRDPFDRIIVGQAAANTSLLLTRDRTILGNYARATW